MIMANQAVVDIFKNTFWNPTGEHDVYAFSCYPYIPDDKKAKVRSVFGIDRSETILLIRNYAPFWRSLSSGGILTDSAFYYISEDRETSFTIELSVVKEVQYQEQILYFYGYNEGEEATVPVGEIVNFNDYSNSVFNKSGNNLAKMLTQMAQSIAPPVDPSDDADEHLDELEKKGKTDEALLFAKKCVGDFPDYASYFSKRWADFCLAKKDFPQAVEAASRGLEDAEYGSVIYTRLAWQRYVANENLGNYVEARKDSLGVARYAEDDWKYNDGDSVREIATNDFFNFNEEYLSHFLDMPYKDRKALLIVEKYDNLYQKRLAVLDSESDFSNFSFPIGHPVANQLYIGHPLIPGKYIPFEDYQLEFVEDRVREFCEFVQDLGATEISIECLNSSYSDSNTSGNKTYSGGVEGAFRGVSGSATTGYSRHLIEELSKAISLHQTFEPKKKPFLHPNMIWYQNEPSWQRLFNQRMNGGLSTHEERIETKKSQMFEGKELLDLKAEIKGLFVNLNVGFDQNEERKFEQQENAVLSIKVKFAPLNQLNGEKDTIHTQVDNSHHQVPVKDKQAQQQIESRSKSSTSENEQEYLSEYKECVSLGEISSGERRLLDKLRDKLGITPTRAKELEESLNAPKLTEEEQEYLDEYQAVVVDGKITEKERRLLEKLRKMLGLTEDRVKELESFSFEVCDEGKNVPEKEQMSDPGNSSNANSELDELVFTVGDTSFKMKLVKGGTFTMGDTFSDESELLEDESDAIPHEVSLDDYFIGETVVTQGLWKSVMGRGKFEDENLPANGLSWNDCQLFINRLNDILGSQLNNKRFALPTEAQWEYAARGGLKSKGFEYSGSDNADEVAWYADNTNGSVQLVKQKKPNELGIYDMSGNVFEWCSDWYDYDYYQRSSQDNPLGPASGEKRVLRGGGCYQEEFPYSVYSRYLLSPSENDSEMGFRLALKVIPETKEVNFLNGDKYVGKLDSHGNISGNGTCYYSNGDRYDGEFKDGKRHGKGITRYADGQRYEGNYKDDKEDGYGCFYQTNGRKYFGDFKKGKFDGHGSIYSQNGNVIYEGEFKNGEMNGQGVLYCDNGDWYKGEFLNGQRNGKGIQYWANGEKYNGEWKEDKMDGLGKYFFADCTFKKCEYKNGILQRWID